MNAGTGEASHGLGGLVQGADDAGAALAGTRELDGSANLGLHGTLAELTLVGQALGLVGGEVPMNKVHVKTGDTVVILSGKDKGKKGKVLEVSPKEGKVIVEGLNIATKHVKPRRQGEQGGIVEAEAAMYASKVQAVCPKCGKPTRVAHKFLEDGTKVRVCKNADCGEEF